MYCHRIEGSLLITIATPYLKHALSSFDDVTLHGTKNASCCDMMLFRYIHNLFKTGVMTSDDWFSKRVSCHLVCWWSDIGILYIIRFPQWYWLWMIYKCLKEFRYGSTLFHFSIDITTKIFSTYKNILMNLMVLNRSNIKLYARIISHSFWAWLTTFHGTRRVNEIPFYDFSQAFCKFDFIRSL